MSVDSSEAQDESSINPDEYPDDFSEWPAEALLAYYDQLVSKGADMGARGMSFGSAVMEASPVKRELKERDLWEGRND